jgi:hypothetical protein
VAQGSASAMTHPGHKVCTRRTGPSTASSTVRPFDLPPHWWGAGSFESLGTYAESLGERFQRLDQLGALFGRYPPTGNVECGVVQRPDRCRSIVARALSRLVIMHARATGAWRRACPPAQGPP